MKNFPTTRFSRFHSILFYCYVLFTILSCPVLSFNSTKPNIVGPGDMQVNSFTGNLFIKRNDLSLPGRSLYLDISFFYNSGQTAIDSGYGSGWSFSYNMYYYFDASDVIIKNSDGSKDKFTWNGSTYDPPTGVFNILEEYQSNKFRLTTNHGMKYFFDESSHKKLTKIEDLNGNTITISYSSGLPISITDPSSRNITLSWTNNHLTQITDANFTPSRSISYQYDEDGNQVHVTNPLGNTVNYGYGSWCNITGITDGRSNTVNITYDVNKAVGGISTSITNKTIVYDTENKQTVVTEEVTSGNQTTTYTFDDNGRLIKLTDPSSQFVTFEYDSDNNITKYTDAESNITTYTFDAKGNLLTETDAAGTRTYTYETNFNKMASIQDKNGNTTSYTYDADGNLTGISKPLGISESYSYDSYGNMTGFTDGDGNTTSYSYNSHGNVTAITYPIGSESFTYDNAGNRLSYTNANGNTSNYTYDKLNRLTSVSDPLSHTTTYAYDANGNMTSLSDENSNTTTYIYDALNRLIGVTASSGSTNYTYDQAGNLKSMRDANGHTSTYNYNLKNLLSSETDPASHTTSYTYDNNGNLITRTDANGNTTNYTYDASDRITGKSYTGNSDSYGYDSEGNMTIASNNNISITFTYDALNRLTNKAITTWSKSISCTYDDSGNRLTMTDPDGGVTNYTYDSNNRLTAIQNPLSQSTTFTYDNGGRTTRQDNANGTYTTYSYDNADNLTTLINYNSSGVVLSSYSYTYDNKGNRLSMTDKDAGVNSYTYDNTDQVTSVSYSDGSSEDFTYDSWGNRTQLVKDGVTANYTYDNADRIQTAGSVTYTFDNNGNMTAETVGGETTMYAYDVENRLTQITFPNTKTNTFSYCPSGLRISKTDTSGGVTKYFYDGVNAIIEMDNGGTTTARYTAGLNIDQWISMDMDGNSYFYQKDALGSITGLTDASETIAKTYDYDVFGEIKNESGTLVSPYCFTGREYEPESNLYYYRSRYYDAVIGRFNKKDLWRGDIFLPITLQKYSYVLNQPINNIDPLGLKIWVPPPPPGFTQLPSGLYVPSSSVGVAGAATTSGVIISSASAALAIYGSAQTGWQIGNWLGERPIGPGGQTVHDYWADQFQPIFDWWYGNGDQDGPPGGGGSDPLPVELSSFTAEQNDGYVTLLWETETEVNNYGFNIYRGKVEDGKYYAVNSVIISGAGNSNVPHNYKYIDSTVVDSSTYYYKLQQVDNDGSYTWYGTITVTLHNPITVFTYGDNNLPAEYVLFQNSPNPFNPETTIRIAVPKNTNVKLEVFNILGQKVSTVVNQIMEAGYHEVKFNMGGMSAGVYIYRLTAGEFSAQKKMVILK